MKTDFDNFRILWAGEWPLWQAVSVALVVACIIWFLYRTESKKGTSGRLRWFLPTLRCLAIITIILTLAGPVLRFQKEEGNRGRVTVFLDSSGSMGLKDSTFSSARKILLANEHGFLPKESNLVDFSLHEAGQNMKKVARLLREQDSRVSNRKKVGDIRKLINSSLKTVEDIDAEFQVITKDNHLLEEVWLNLDGDQTEELLKSKVFKDSKPDRTSYLTKAESSRNAADRFGRRIRAFIKPPIDGEYTFAIFSDDSSLLRIAEPGKKNFKKIVETKSHTSFSWSENLQSKPQFLEAGKLYPIEMIHKEGSGDDFCAFGWTLPNGENEKPIPGKRFSSPLSPTDTKKNLPFSGKIRQKFNQLIDSKSDLVEIDFNLLSIEAFEIALLLEEEFDRYANSLLGENIISLNEGIANFEKFSRIERATRLLNHPKNGFLEELKETHLLEIRNLSENATEVIWDNFSENTQFDSKVNPESSYTDLSNGILDALKVETDKENKKAVEKVRTAAVLITDGGHNREGSPLETAKLLSARNLPIYTVGLGSDIRPPDFALLGSMVPDSVYQEDRIKGALSIKDHLVPGTPYQVIIHDEHNKTVWEKSLVGVEAGISQLSFDFPTKEIVDRSLEGISGTERDALRTIPLNFSVNVSPIEGEAETDNNKIVFSIDANMRKNQLLILDSRPRWETRYLNNLFERDDRWETSCVWGEQANEKKDLPRGEEKNYFPIEREKLFEFDLIIFGEIPPEEFSIDEQNWLVDFVNQRGGGILFIDGPRQKLRTYENLEKHPIFSLLPIGWIDNGPTRLSPSAFFRPEEANRLAALTLDPIKERNEQVWEHLPLPAWTSPVESLPGSEVFLEVSLKGDDQNQSKNNRIPVLVGKQAGAGKSFYLAFDETWRWRYEVADLYHQRFWNQLTSRVMEKPFALNQESLSLDVGGSIHSPEKGIPIRARLRNEQGKAPEPPYPEVDALIWNGDDVVATIPLQGKDFSNGLFSGEVYGLEMGSYEISIRAPTILNEIENSLQKLPFEVKSNLTEEKNFLTCDENLLEEMAEVSGGRFFREENFHKLKEVLRPISSGRIIITEITLWQSFGWLGFVVFLLALEMFLRKRAGML